MRAQTTRAAAGIAPGVVLSLVVAAACMVVNHVAAMASPLLLAIVVGAVLANLRGVPAALQPGLDFSGRRLLRAGIVLLGLQLSLQDVAGLGAGMVVVVVAVVSLGILATMVVGSWLGLSWTQRILIACGFSICGAAAVAAADGVVDAEEDEVATGVALVVLFGTAMIAVVPALSAVFGLGSHTAGLWAGASIHEVAQVVAAAGAIGGGALAVAVVTKLARVLRLAPVMAAIGIHRRRQVARMGGDAEVTLPVVPLFLVGFAVMVAFGSLLTIPTAVAAPLKLLQTGLLAAAMFALGCGVRRSALKAVGARPFVLALLATVVVAAISLVGVLLLG
jgi:uncharacterized integral membrane protein (TIGR00698 family)